MLNADLGRVVILGLPLSVLLAGVGWFWSRRFAGTLLPGEKDVPVENSGESSSAVSIFRAYLPVALPLLLISLGSLTRFGATENTPTFRLDILNGIGHPIFALSVGVLAALTLPRLGERSGNAISEAIMVCAQVLAITAAGGAFGLVIRESALGGWLQQAMSGWRIGVLVPFLVAAAVKSAQGSSTVALITASAMVAPLIEPLGLAGSAWGPALTVVSVGCGAMCVSHANDSYFWVVSQMAGIPPEKAYGSYTVATGLMGLCGAAAVCFLAAVIL
jgi:GntP family gluconate:H+ symporter